MSPSYSTTLGASDDSNLELLLFLFNGSAFVDKAISKVEESFGRENRNFVCLKARHYARLFFQKFYSKMDWHTFNYVDTALACCYLALKVQDSKEWRALSVKEFLRITYPSWRDKCDRSTETMEYILPRMECIVLSGINFDLTLNIPHKYVQKCCHAAYGVCCEEVNKRLPSLPSKDVDFVHLIRFFLDIVLSSWLCIVYEPKVLAAAAVQYASEKHIAHLKAFYRPSWLASLGLSASEVQNILRQRHELSYRLKAEQSKEAVASRSASSRRPRAALSDSSPDLGDLAKRTRLQQPAAHKSPSDARDARDARGSRSPSENRSPRDARDARDPLVPVVPLVPLDPSLPVIPSSSSSSQSAALPAPIAPIIPNQRCSAQPAPLIQAVRDDPSAQPAPLTPLTPLTPLIQAVRDDPSAQPAPLIRATTGSAQPAPLQPASMGTEAAKESFWRPHAAAFPAYKRTAGTKQELVVNAI